ncbi:hypothetical protein GCM10010397_48260 [Streptomyces spinoverrucosus]|nr:hypothetical protein GCM10010397_48260 [Streptomyces spinoverrucosus]
MSRVRMETATAPVPGWAVSRVGKAGVRSPCRVVREPCPHGSAAAPVPVLSVSRVRKKRPFRRPTRVVPEPRPQGRKRAPVTP